MQLSEAALALLLPAFLSLTTLAAPVAESGNLGVRPTSSIPQTWSAPSLSLSVTSSYQPSSYPTMIPSGTAGYHPSSYPTMIPSGTHLGHHRSSPSGILRSSIAHHSSTTTTSSAAAPTNHQESLEQFEATHDPNNPADQQTAGYLYGLNQGG